MTHKVYEPYIRAQLEPAAHCCGVVVLNLPIGSSTALILRTRVPRTARWLTRVSRPQNLWCDVTKAVLFAPPKWNALQGGKACLLIRKNDHLTPTREIRQRVRALARHHPNTTQVEVSKTRLARLHRGKAEVSCCSTPTHQPMCSTFRI